MRALILTAAMVLTPATAMASEPTELSATTQLQDRREVTAGTRAYSVGFEDGHFYANGWHITGEMGGVWTPPMKMLDGLWFGVDGQWAGPATSSRAGRDTPATTCRTRRGLHLQRTDFVPDDQRAALFGLQLTNPGAQAKTVTVKVDARSELMGSYPWSGTVPSTKDTNGPDSGSFDGNALVFTDQQKTALVAANQKPRQRHHRPGLLGPADRHRLRQRLDRTCPASATTARSATAPAAS